MAIRHISVAGDLGSGKSSVSRLVAKLLGAEVVSTGSIQRAMASELSLSTLETNFLAERDRRIDREVDAVTERLGATSDHQIVFDSRMAWRTVPGSFKVRLLVDPLEAAKRVFNRNIQAEVYASVGEAADGVSARFESERRRFLNRYGVDVASLKHYDLVIDTTAGTISQVVNLILDRLRAAPVQREVYICPDSVLCCGRTYPTAYFGELPGLVPVAYARPRFFVIGASHLIEEARAKSQPFVRAEVVAEGDEPLDEGITPSSLLERHRAHKAAVTEWCD